MADLPPSYELVADGSTHGVPVGDGMVGIGRSPRNEVVLDDPRISKFHARVWSDGADLWVADAGSTHGTTVNGRALRRAARLHPGDVLELADAVRFTVRVGIGAPRAGWLIEDLATGVRVRPRGGVLRIGGADADLRADVEPAVVQRMGADIVLLDRRGTTRTLDPDAPVDLGGLAIALRRVDAVAPASTAGKPDAEVAVVVEAVLDPAGPRVVVTDPAGAEVCTVTRGNAATLLYLLAAGWSADDAWVLDDDLVVGTWGRARLADPGNTLKVTLHRLREKLEGHGIPKRVIEREGGRTRLRVLRATAVRS